MASLISPVRKPHQRKMWIKCETPTTKRTYFIHRRTGKISWSDPFAEPKPKDEEENAAVENTISNKTASLAGSAKRLFPSSPIHIDRKPFNLGTMGNGEDNGIPSVVGEDNDDNNSTGNGNNKMIPTKNDRDDSVEPIINSIISYLVPNV